MCVKAWVERGAGPLLARRLDAETHRACLSVVVTSSKTDLRDALLHPSAHALSFNFTCCEEGAVLAP